MDAGGRNQGAEDSTELLVVGGGIIGLCTAYYATKMGAKVVLLDRGEIGSGATYGNAGLVVPSHVTPLAAPSIVGKGLRWMLDPESPFYIRPRWDAELLRWLWAFRSYCTEAHVRNASRALLELNTASARLYRELQDAGVLEDCFTRKGLLYIYLTEREFKAGAREAESLRQSGFDMAKLDPGEVEASIPGVSPEVAGGILHRESGHVIPDRLVECLRKEVVRLGVEVRTGVEATELMTTEEGKVVGVRCDSGPVFADRVVLASGALAPRLLRKIGVRLPIQPGKGYSVTVKLSGCEPPQFPSILAEGYVAVTPMADRLRFAGTLELSGDDLTIDPRRIAGVLKTVRRFLPGLGEWQTLETWAGLRPCLPDGLPAIGIPEGRRNLVVAAGHAKIGILLGPITGKLTAQLALGVPTEIDVAPYSLGRFG